MDKPDHKASLTALQQELDDLRKEKEKYQLIVEFTNDFEYWMDPKGRFKYVSPSSRNLTGYPSESFFKQDELFFQMIHPDDLAAFKEYIENSLDLLGLGERLAFKLITKTMHIKYCEVSSKAVYDKNGKYLGQRGSIRDISRLTEVLQEVKSISESKVWEEQAKNRFKNIAEQRDRELTSSLMQMSEKNELLQYISRKLNKLASDHAHDRTIIKDLLARIQQEENSAGQWDEFKVHFENSNPGFFDRLISRYPLLTQKDLKLCAFLRLHLSTKEIASLLNITAKSAEISRVRLRKKLKLKRSDNLSTIITRI